MSEMVRKYIPNALLFILGILMFAEFYLHVPDSYVGVMKVLSNYVIIIVAFSMALGALTLLFHHGNLVRVQREGQWFYSLWLLIVMFVFILLGLTTGTSSTQYTWLFNNFFRPIDMTLYSLIGWLVVYAIYLTFRARNKETLFLIIIAFFTLIGNAPIGSAVFPPLAGIKSWLGNVPNAAAMRGFNLAGTIGSIVISLRTLAGMEKAALGG